MRPGSGKLPGRALVFTIRRLNHFFHAVVERSFEGPHTFCSFWPGLEPVNLQRAFYKHHRRHTAGNNLTDEDYRIHGSGQNEPGFNCIMALDWRFGR